MHRRVTSSAHWWALVSFLLAFSLECCIAPTKSILKSAVLITPPGARSHSSRGRGLGEGRGQGGAALPGDVVFEERAKCKTIKNPVLCRESVLVFPKKVNCHSTVILQSLEISSGNHHFQHLPRALELGARDLSLATREGRAHEGRGAGHGAGHGGGRVGRRGGRERKGACLAHRRLAQFLEWLLPLLVQVLVAGALHHPPLLTSQNMTSTTKSWVDQWE